MDRFVIRGGAPLAGVIPVSGSKNAGLPIPVAAAILGTTDSRITNVPELQDIHTMARLLRHLGSPVEVGDGVLDIGAADSLNVEAEYDLVRRMRASIYVLGPLLARFGEARVSFPGGCAIGARPVDIHLRGMEALGASIEVEHGFIIAKATKLRGADMSLMGPQGTSVGATANVMMAAVLAEGVTTIRDAAVEPEVADLAGCLTAMGARIEGAGTRTIAIEGVGELHGADYALPPDRIESASYILAGAITRGDIRVRGAERRHLGAVLGKLTEADIWLDWEGKDVRVTVPNGIRSVDVDTGVYPGFPTDVQAQYMGLMCMAQGKARIVENIFTDRFMHALELQRMGADIQINGNVATVTGVDRLTGAPVMASDLRAGMVLVLAGLAAEGETVVSRVYHIDRGYERIEEKLRAAGADIQRVSD
ncbi:UDP-N-acetylglucosamine 1-carboxyvinyltransferase [Candidatus Poribacteria bacterium]|jgi:UDP-N-acetylglucosamine 1-carboxyvinyltransferase|nr:UDP-N-acetylglucosamine 1-carboxyvinyltransferase [Candidatus Poribacteria bacterium]MBT5533968.1 UDP-N-acetylglucosamine 1-carboxyvinyltransferase [Candidatus Poribacteria bacterium]MBT5711928.1 UDP-N-acetylglucosamine 1-carboxyvinyltransferase [Candidatus Poribacteria bacterium]MBT7099839.1 UDP-N-acetylglucosamine 1-carboxyvinyltransferase [Candidatus Poribacteria bacterium]MBT7804466.1 UDP-N-acetylglucosamine 1-carboxyvinyltransferase [Candidatus Poribacteria bacterium]